MTTLAILILVSTLTPGPNTLVLLHRGASAGFRAGVPAGLGIAFGGSVLLAAMLALLAAGPVPGVAMPWLAGAAAAVLLAMAASLWRARADGGAAPLASAGFWTMAAFQWANPKAWSFLASLAALQTAVLASPAAMIALFAAISLLCSALWLGGGRLLQRHLASPRRARLFNRSMALAMAATAALLFFRAWRS